MAPELQIINSAPSSDASAVRIVASARTPKPFDEIGRSRFYLWNQTRFYIIRLPKLANLIGSLSVVLFDGVCVDVHGERRRAVAKRLR